MSAPLFPPAPPASAQETRDGAPANLRIKVSTNFPGEPIVRQTPGGSGKWNGCRFHVNDPAVTECDVWVVLEGLSQLEAAFVRQGTTIFFAYEPPASEEYQPGFLRQFDLVVASHPRLRHRNVRNDCQGLPWHVGMDRGLEGNRYLDPIACTIDYDQFRRMTPPKKTALMSIVVSDQVYLEGHRQRRAFVDALKLRWGDDLHVYGRGINPVRDKFDALAPYVYSLVLENSVTPHYWSEKLADCFLSFTYPIYWGCPNIYNYFPTDSLAAIDVTKINQALDRVERIVASDTAAANMAALLEARDLVLNRYNTFEVMRRACVAVSAKAARQVVLKPGNAFYNPYHPRNLARRIPRIPGKLKRMIGEMSLSLARR